jgi:hypothetical protein
MPQIVPTYACPVCENVRPQRGAVGKHLLTHTIQELEPHIANREAIVNNGAHPEIHVEDTIYKLCITGRIGFEKGKSLDTKHVCTHTYNHLLVQAPAPAQEAVQVEDEVLQIITCELGEFESKHEKCGCHIEINLLKQQIATQMSELNALREWRDTIIDTAPKNVIIEQPKPKPKAEKEKKNPVIKASKKEKELGMWCTQCAACKCAAQFATDLRPCGTCKKLCHFNDDLHSCYHWDCEICKKQVCLQCVRAVGATKLHPLCSEECSKKYKSKRA